MRITKSIFARNALVKPKVLTAKEKISQIVADIEAEKLKKLANSLLAKERLTRLTTKLG